MTWIISRSHTQRTHRILCIHCSVSVLHISSNNTDRQRLWLLHASRSLFPFIFYIRFLHIFFLGSTRLVLLNLLLFFHYIFFFRCVYSLLDCHNISAWCGCFSVSFYIAFVVILFTRFVVKSELDTELNTNDVESVWDMVCCLCIRRMHYKHVFLCWRMCVVLEMCDIYFFFLFFSSLYSNQLTHNLTLCSI